MRNYIVYQQGLPLVRRNGSEAINLQQVGEIQAANGKQAIAACRKMPCFLKGKGLGKFPIVEEVGADGEPVEYNEERAVRDMDMTKYDKRMVH